MLPNGLRNLLPAPGIYKKRGMKITGEYASDKNTASQSVTNSAVLVNVTNGTFPVVAATAFRMHYFVPFTLVAGASGYRFQLIVPAVTSLVTTYTIFSNVSTLIDSKIQVASAVINGAAAAGDYYLIVEANVLASAAGNVTLQFAQNVADANAITIMRGMFFNAFKI